MSIDVSNLRPTIIPKSDQLNADQLVGGPMTVTITEVRVTASDDQPVIIHYQGENGRPYKPCKTMRKVLIFAWGEDGRQWAGRSMTLYNDPSVRFGNAEVGGIRISHMTDIEQPVRVSLAATKGKKALHTIEPLTMATIEQVKAAISAATNKDGMKRAKALAIQLPSNLIPEALELYRAKLLELTKPGKPSEPDQSAA
jgi:hypothetical protein